MSPEITRASYITDGDGLRAPARGKAKPFREKPPSNNNGQGKEQSHVPQQHVCLEGSGAKRGRCKNHGWPPVRCDNTH